MAFRKKPAPVRRGRTKVTTEVTTGDEADTQPADAVVETETVEVTKTTTAAAGGGLEMALIVVTLVALIAAFLLLQIEMRSAFGKGWPV